VVHGETGLLVPPSYPTELAGAILQLLVDPNGAREMGAAGRKRYLERYTAERMARETLEVYREVLGRTNMRSEEWEKGRVGEVVNSELSTQHSEHGGDRAIARRTL